MDARIRFTAADEPSAELPFSEDEDAGAEVVAFARDAQDRAAPDPLDELRGKVERAELLARQAENNLRVAVARAELVALRSKD
jgi:hypothetical protein